MTRQTLFLDLEVRLQPVIPVTTRTTRRFHCALRRLRSRLGMGTGEVARESAAVTLPAKAVNSCAVPDLVRFDGVIFHVKVLHARTVAGLALRIRLPVLDGMSLRLNDDLHVTEKAGNVRGLVLALGGRGP